MVTGKRSGNLAATLEVRHHKLLTGVLPDVGGNDEGPDPHELVEAALVGCTIITVQMYANRKQMKLESTDVRVKIVSEGKEGARIEREVTFHGDLTPEERARLLDIANKCPIHRLLSGKIEIETRMLD